MKGPAHLVPCWQKEPEREALESTKHRFQKAKQRDQPAGVPDSIKRGQPQSQITIRSDLQCQAQMQPTSLLTKCSNNPAISAQLICMPRI